jgi:dTDP-4-amino-4,6-dideoxygalactose transaminase
MTNIQASILYGQLGAINIILAEKERVFNLYRKLLGDIPNVAIQGMEVNTWPSNWMMGVRLLNSNKDYNYIENWFKERNVEIRPMFYPMSYHEKLKEYSDVTNEKNAKILSNECFIIPSYPELSDKQIIYITNLIKELS